MPLSLALDALLDTDAEPSLPLDSIGPRPLEAETPRSEAADEAVSGSVAPAAPAERPRHRRSRSDPTDWLRSLRAGSPTDDEDCAHTNKRSQASRTGASPERKRHAPNWLGVEEEPDDELMPKGSKKDLPVPMWTMEEDMFIADMVEQYGKRWSKIAAQMPGRTDNGVRNRWNRMEKAQNLREARGPRYGYRCRRCGMPKRGHTCPALTAGGDATGDADANDAAAGMGARVAAAAAAAAQGGSGAADAGAIPLTASFVFDDEAAADPDAAASSSSSSASEPESGEATPPKLAVVATAVPEAAPPPAAAPPPVLPLATPPPLGLRASEEPIDEQKLDDFLRDLQLSAGLLPFEEAAPAAADSLFMSTALDYLYPPMAPASVATLPPSPSRPLGVC